MEYYQEPEKELTLISLAVLAIFILTSPMPLAVAFVFGPAYAVWRGD